MIRSLLCLACLALAGSSFAGCQSPVTPAGAPAAAESVPPPATSAPDTARTAALPRAVAPERLAALLPSQVGDLRRASVTSNSDSAMGMTVSRAQGTYGTGPQAVTLLVVDVGSAEGVRLMGMGVPPTGRLKGQPVHRTQTSTRSSVRMQVQGRYVVEASGNRVGLDLLDVFVQTILVSPLPE